MSELTTMSITVTVAPHTAGALTALVEQHLAAPPVKRSPKRRSNTVTSVTGGNVFQIGTMYGDVHTDRDR
ncbi:hypothetical protein ACFWNN_32135 [Lentzea sp. NPDC058450]|uniref:hypothetical protein n=1 Tax=Lentzea sp. NPDC058450 TaxID=3346505 RepID=UPI00364AA06F